MEESEFCILCCSSFKTFSNPEFTTDQNNFKEFCKEVLNSKDNALAILINQEDATFPPGSLPACPECLMIISDVMASKGKVRELEGKVKKLKEEILMEEKKLEGEMEEYRKEMGKMEEVVKDSDVQALEGFMGRKGEALGMEGKAAIVHFRNSILTASTEFQLFQTKLHRKRKSSKKKTKTDSVDPIDCLKVEMDVTGPSKRARRSKPEGLPLDVVVKQSTSDVEGEDDPEAGDPYNEDYNEGDNEYVPPEDLNNDELLSSSESSSEDEDSDESDSNDEVEKPSPSKVEEKKKKIKTKAEKKKFPTPKKNSKHKESEGQAEKKKRKPEGSINDYAHLVVGMSDFRAGIVKRSFLQQEKKKRKDAEREEFLRNGDAHRTAVDYLIDDPSEHYAFKYDFNTGQLQLETVGVVLNDGDKSLTCTFCSFTAKTEGEGDKGKDSGEEGEKKKRPHYGVFHHMFHHILGKHLEAFKCAICGSVLHVRSTYKNHIRGHQNKYFCEACSKPFSSKGALRCHQWLKHMTEEEIKAAIASGEPDPRERIKRHKEKLILQHCPTCGKGFPCAAILKTHMETHLDRSERESVVCPRCGKHLLRSGWVSHQANSCQPPGTEKIICPHCPPSDNPYLYPSPALFKRHLKRCHSTAVDERPCLCTICGKGFKLLADLKRHVETHSDARPYECKHECGANFKTRKHCTRHEGTCRRQKFCWTGPRKRKGAASNEHNEEPADMHGQKVDLDFLQFS